ncbi:TlpA family protein disulfide reductase [Maribacter flavus]|uniref:TlpA family protein disulfide reductase n=1 Tax=Maribacter flavus TaxID=1658664 RepID=A0A5B2TS19_9FLAO|nr:TlpA disulfide reductase family protein [Maribacter flavus]KAA2217386.1 TlpA family protein disulfide reductase [Maribacter flavus]
MELNQPIPEWNLLPIFSEEVPSLKDFKGKPLLILFFNLGCPGCKGRALPYANRVVVENGEHIKVLGIHTRFEGPEYEVSDFEKAKEDYYIRFPFFKDANLAETFHSYEAGGTPHWILLDSEGKLVYSIFGSDPNNALLRLDLKIGELLDVSQKNENE